MKEVFSVQAHRRAFDLNDLLEKTVRISIKNVWGLIEKI